MAGEKGADIQANTKRRKTTDLTDAIDEVAEEEPRGADEELLPPGAIGERNTEQGPRLLLVLHASVSSNGPSLRSPVHGCDSTESTSTGTEKGSNRKGTLLRMGPCLL